MAKTKLDLIIEAIELPASAYETAISRYEDLGDFLTKDSSICKYEPQVFVQGSFRLGTAIKPLVSKEPYDLDLTCKLTEGLSKSSITQKDFKNLVGKAIDEYIKKRGISEAKEEKRRCWRIEYQDKLSFHMDIVPGIIMEDTSSLRESIMMKSNVSAHTAAEWAGLAYNITDNKKMDYEIISDDWNISNPEGYAKWFEQRMKTSLNRSLVEASYEKLKTFEHKSILQRCVQILKRHRDVMFNRELELKPASIIITTLSGQAYNGERTVEDAISNIVDKMGSLILRSGIRIANPTRPEEDFTDKWKENPALENAFNRWRMQAKADFGNIETGSDLQLIISKINKSFSIVLNESMFSDSILKKNINIQPHRVEIDEDPPRPHMCI